MQYLANISKLIQYPSDKSELLFHLEIIQNELGYLEEINLIIDLINDMSLSELEMSYSSTFDMNPKSHLYVGNHLFGESYKRSNLMIALKEIYRKYNYTWNSKEMVDYLPVILDFLSTREIELVREMTEDLLLSVLHKIVYNKPIFIELPMGTELKSMDQDLKGMLESSSSVYIDLLRLITMILEDNVILQEEELS